MGLFDKIKKKNRQTIQKSVDWFKKQIRNIELASMNVVLGKQLGMTTNLMPGHMYLFHYDAKWKDELPYWDKFPLILPFNKYPDGFIGLNLHYLDYEHRFILLEALFKNAVDSSISGEKKLAISWHILQQSSKLPLIEPCVHRYLDNHVKSKFLQIKFEDWVSAAMLPIEKFQKATKENVWKDSLRRRP